jgi:hypothetical protein
LIVPFPQPPAYSHRQVHALTGTPTRLGIAMRTTQCETQAARLCDEIEALTTCLAHAEAPSIEDLRAKAVVLRSRLEEQLDDTAGAEATTLALVASIIMDLEHLPS